MTVAASAPPRTASTWSAAASLGALGVVFGDIGTSPLYTLKTVLDLTGNHRPETILGVVSLLVWTLILVTTIKYAGFAMRIDNDGEGGILALMALLGVKRRSRPLIVALGLFGAALIYGDGAVTPAISVLSALEGLDLVAPGLHPYVLPLAVVILLILFALQPQGTARIGRAFGPVMALWFSVLALLGIGGILRAPGILWALNPWHAVDYLVHGHGFLVLGGVFLCVTGAEALYADMGHFGPRPIKFAWSALVFPSLVLNYAGQGAIVLDGTATDQNIFFRLCPDALMLPMIVLATVATIIASQSIITGAFSMTRQAMRLGWMPRMRVVQTSQEGYGQIYVAAVNWALMVVTIGLALGFGKSDNLAAAYGIAVSATMLMTSALLFIAMREIWGWPLLAAGAVASVFAVVDAAFLASNLSKFVEGGYVPLVLAVLVYGVMFVWHSGIGALNRCIDAQPVAIADFLQMLESRRLPRAPGTAVFLTRSRIGTPPLVLWYARHTRALHQRVVSVNVETASVPWVAAADRCTVVLEAPGFERVEARFGFMERPDVPQLLQQLSLPGGPIDPRQIDYFAGLEKVVARDDGQGLPRWMEALFSVLVRNCARASDAMHIPPDQLMELGRQVAL